MEQDREIQQLRRQIDELQDRLALLTGVESLPDTPTITILYCDVGIQRAALLLEQVDEVLPMAQLTPVPEAPDWIAGMLNLRGEPLAVLDVLARVQQSKRASDIGDFIIVGRSRGQRLGMIVQGVQNIDEVARERIQKPPSDLPIAPYLLGVISTSEGRPTVLLSTGSLIKLSNLPNDLSNV